MLTIIGSSQANMTPVHNRAFWGLNTGKVIREKCFAASKMPTVPGETLQKDSVGRRGRGTQRLNEEASVGEGEVDDGQLVDGQPARKRNEGR